MPDMWLPRREAREIESMVEKRGSYTPLPGTLEPAPAPGSGQAFVTRDKQRLGWARVCRITGRVTGLYPYEAGKEPDIELRSEHLVPLVADPRSG